MSEGSIGTVRAARSGTSPWATQVGYTAFAWARLLAAAYVHWAFGGTVLLGENSGQSAGNLFDQDPLSYVIGRLNGFPTSFMHRGYHLSRVPTLGHKTRVAADCTMALLFGREVVSLGQVEHPRWEWESAALAQATGPRLVQTPRERVGEEGARRHG